MSINVLMNNILYVIILVVLFIIIGVIVFGLEVFDENWRLFWVFGFFVVVGVVYVGVFVILIWIVIRRRLVFLLVVD